MTTTAPTFHQIKAQVAAIRTKLPQARVIGIRAPGRWAGECQKRDGEETYRIEQCDSPLAMRIALQETGELNTITVLITGLDDRELSDDILVRLAKRRLFPINAWQIVKSLFQAHAVDPRLVRQGWIADKLMELIPEGGFPSVTGGFLDAETVWPLLLAREIGLAADRPDLLTILKWSTEADAAGRFRSASKEFREATISWLSELAGPTVAAVFRCIHANARPDAVPIGLAAGVVFNAAAKGKLDRAAGKMEERFLGSVTPDDNTIERWSAAATEIIRLQISDPRLKANILARADEILREVGAESYARLSLTSPSGFNQRLEDFGQGLDQVLEGQRYQAVERLIAARDEIGQHDLAGRARRRLDCADMAIRLVRWLRFIEEHSADEARSLVEAAKYQVAEGGFADWARLTLRLGDPVRQISEAYSKLFDRVTELREVQSRRFGELLRSWIAADSKDDALIPVENVLKDVVTPLAARNPVLLIVLDGMSVAVCRELCADLIGHEWVPIGREGRESLLGAGLATVPSVTEVSRTSLLCGALRQGSAQDEESSFAAHPSLRTVSRSGYPPILFHKASLRGESDAILSSAVCAEIESSNRRVVGVVINAVDDQLLKGEQLDLWWSRERIPVLPALLHEASNSGRIVILTSDHGHVLDSRTEARAHEGGERWRFALGDVRDGELQVSGPRVLIPESATLFAPWSERIRYGIKKNGYHGGINPQEMVVPIVVLSPSENLPDGWVYVPVDAPAWWDEPIASSQSSEAGIARHKPAKPIQAKLVFNREEGESQPIERPVAPVVASARWVTQLIASPIYNQQKKLAGRSVPSDEIVRSILDSLDQRGGKLTSAAVSRALAYPAIRLPGLLAVMQRVLNIDGYAVLSRDETSDTVELNRELLKRQFDLR